MVTTGLPSGSASGQTWNSSAVYRGPDGSLVYHSDDEGNRIPDFSHSGYRGGGVPLPHLPVRIILEPCPSGDDTDSIQQALDMVGGLEPDEHGHRGAVLLTEGVYRITRGLYILHSGVVLRGSGDDADPGRNTIIRSSKNIDDVAVRVGRGGVDWSMAPGSPVTSIASEFVPAGSRFVELEDAEGFEPGDDIILFHKATWEWIEAVDHGGRPPTAMNPWTPDDENLNIVYKRVVVEKSGNILQLDVPVFNHLDRSLSVVQVFKPDMTVQIRESGVEHFRLVLESDGPGMDNHTEHALMFDGVENGWAYRVTVLHFRNTGLGTANSSFITVSNSRALEPHSPITGGRRNHFRAWERSNNILFVHNTASRGRHCFDANGAALSSGIVFLHSVSHHAYSSSEGHRRWSQGLLFDNITFVNPNVKMVLGLYNRGDFGTRHGWSAAHSVIWNSDPGPDGRILIQKPPAAQNYGIANRGTMTSVGPWPGPAGFMEGAGQTPEMASLYEAQLWDRLLFGIPPDAPARLTAAADWSWLRANLSWQHAGLSEMETVIERSHEEGPFREIARIHTAQGSFVDEDLSSGRYRYRIAVHDGYRRSAWSNPAVLDFRLPDITLNTPGSGSTFHINREHAHNLEIWWYGTDQGAGFEFTWVLDHAGGDFSDPVLIHAADAAYREDLQVHVMQIPYMVVFDALGNAGILPGMPFDGIWTIRASNGGGKFLAALPHTIRLILQGSYTDAGPADPTRPDVPGLQQNYPNPFNSATRILYEIPYEGHVYLAIYDLLGRLVTVLADGQHASGYHEMEWNAGAVASGSYLLILETDGQVTMRLMAVVK